MSERRAFYDHDSAEAKGLLPKEIQMDRAEGARRAKEHWRCLAHMRWIPVGDPCPACRKEEAQES